MMTRSRCALLFLVLLTACESPQEPDPLQPPPSMPDVGGVWGYTVTDLGTLGGDVSQAIAINNDGTIIGNSTTIPGPFVMQNYDWRSFVIEDGVMAPLPTLELEPVGPGRSVVEDVNEAGIIVGHAHEATPEGNCCYEFPVYWENGELQEMGFVRGVEGGYGFGINEAAEMVGVVGGVPFAWSDRVRTNLQLPPGVVRARATGINNHGTIVGWGQTDAWERVLIRWQGAEDQEPEILATTGLQGGMKPRLNDAGWIVWTAGDGPEETHAYLFTDVRGVIDLGTLGGAYAGARDVNELGQIVGQAQDAEGRPTAFLWNPDTEQMVALPYLNGPGTVAYGINDNGDIVGAGPGEDGNWHALLWTEGIVPFPEPEILGAHMRFEFGFRDGERVFYGIGGEIDVRGDFAEAGPGDIHLRADNGLGLTLEYLNVNEFPDRYVLVYWGTFEGEWPPFGSYEVTVTDAHGVTTASYVIGSLEDYPHDAPRLLSPAPGELIDDPEPTFRWEPYDLAYAHQVVPPGNYGVGLGSTTRPGWGAEARPLPADWTAVDYRNDYWLPGQPEPLEPDIYRTEVWGRYQVEERVNVLAIRHGLFYMAPPTLILHPTDHATSAACPDYPDYIVRDELALDMALTVVQPGEVIGVDGMIEVTDPESSIDVRIARDGVTLTCATPGSGLRGAPGSGDVIVIDAADVTVSHLVIDGSQILWETIGSRNYGTDELRAVRSTIVDNEIACSPYFCMWLIANQGALVARNEMVYTGGYGAVQFQGYGPYGENGDQAFNNDSVRVLDNVIRAEAPSYVGWDLGAGIRIRDGNGIVVSGNEITGPFPNAITVANVRGGAFEHNRGTGAELFGFVLDAAPENQRSRGVVLKNNRFTGAGVAGVYVNNACGNTFIGNVLNGNDEAGLVFDVLTGANAFAGNGRLVQDAGSLDCDGDGNIDPNLVTGTGGFGKGVRFGQRVREAIRSLKALEPNRIR